MQPIKIDYFTDTLCIWAYIAQTRINELESEFGKSVDIIPRFFPVFGHAQKKIDKAWQDKGGRKGYAEHVKSVAQEFEHISVHPEIWVKNTPQSSLPSHLYLSAIKLLEQKNELDAGAFTKITWAIREEFFIHCADISNTSVLLSIIEKNKLAIKPIEDILNSGEAYAVLSEDMKMASEMAIKASPTMIFNQDRQRLSGNVGYRIIQSNIRELLHTPVDQHSWC